MWNRGKLVIVFILAVALGATGLSLWHHSRAQRRILDFWGTDNAVLIAEAPRVEVLRLGTARPLGSQEESDKSGPPRDAPDDETPRPAMVQFGQNAWSVESSHAAAEARGTGNLRRALVLDITFDWLSPATADPPQWQYALEVNDGRRWATVLFDFASRSVALAGGKTVTRLDPAANDDFRAFFAEQFPAEAATEK